jgi:hypothetical protein
LIMMKKKVQRIALCLAATAALFTFIACADAATNEADPTGSLVPAPGVPFSPGGGSGPGWGTPDPSYTGRRFDSNNLPSPATWNALGHQHAYPDPFHFANGNKVVTAADWANRRKEISKILQYYEYGIMPSIAPDVVDITFTNSGVANSSITVTHKESGRSMNFSITTNPIGGANLTAHEGLHDLPLWIQGTPGNFVGGTGNFNNGTFGSESDGSGAVWTLYGLTIADPSAPSGNSDYAWGMSVVLTAMEGIDLDGDGVINDATERAFRGIFDENKVGITGYSRNGKATMCISAFAESRNGAQVGYTSVGSAGSGGPSIERFLSPAGYKVNGQFADPLPLDGDGLMEFDGLVGKPWYMKKINNGDLMLGTGVAYQPTIGGTADAWRYRAVRGWAPYYEDFEATPTNYSVSVTTPFIGWQSPAELWSGIQSLSEGRNETPGWFSVRFREFADLHYGLDIDHVRGTESRGKYGILCTIPVDQYYLGALIAPRGLIFQDGFVVPRNNPESQFAHWLIADEVYKAYGEWEGDPEKYIWNNAFEMTWGTHGGNTGNEAADMGYHAMRIFNGDANTTFALANPNLLKLRTPPFPVDDPIGRFDYFRMIWGRPGHPTIAERIHARIDPILDAYIAGEANRPFPAASAAPVHPGTPTGQGFKAMDWRGLIDTPEAL